MILLRSTELGMAEDEKKIVHWFEENFGATDTEVLLEWIWHRERNAASYVGALWHVARGVKEHGKVFGSRLVAFARRPKTSREAEEQLMSAISPVLERVRISILGHRGDPVAIEAGMRELRVRLREEIRSMWPEKHRATIDGALIAGTQVRNGSAFIDFRKLVEVLFGSDALATTAASSHGVTNDR